MALKRREEIEAREGIDLARRARKGASSLTYTVLVVVMVVLALGLSVKLRHRFDLSAAGGNTLSQQTREILDGLSEPVTLYPLFTFPYTAVGNLLHARHVEFPRLRVRRRMYRALHEAAVARGLTPVSVWGFRKDDIPRFSSVTRDNYIGIGVGAAYPKFDWENVAKIQTGFGGIVFMVLAITMVGIVVVIEWLPVYNILISITRGREIESAQMLNAALSGLFVLLICVFCFIVPMEIGLRRLEEREIW